MARESEGKAETGSTAADNQNIVLVSSGHGAQCLLLWKVKYMMPLKDLAFDNDNPVEYIRPRG